MPQLSESLGQVSSGLKERFLERCFLVIYGPYFKLRSLAFLVVVIYLCFCGWGITRDKTRDTRQHTEGTTAGHSAALLDKETGTNQTKKESKTWRPPCSVRVSYYSVLSLLLDSLYLCLHYCKLHFHVLST